MKHQGCENFSKLSPKEKVSLFVTLAEDNPKLITRGRLKVLQALKELDLNKHNLFYKAAEEIFKPFLVDINKIYKEVM